MTTLLRRDAVLTIAAAAALPVSARAVPAAAAPSATDPADLSVTQALGELASRRRSPTKLLDACLHRIARDEPTLRAFVTRTTGHARMPPARATRATPTAGSDALADWVPDEDATVVAHLHDAGAVMVGKTVTHEFAFGASSPPTRNPWDPRRHPGGSSGGSPARMGALRGAAVRETAWPSTCSSKPP